VTINYVCYNLKLLTGR